MAREEFIGNKDTIKCMVTSKDCTLYISKKDEYGKYDDPQPIKLKGALFMDMYKKALEELEKSQDVPNELKKVSIDTIKNEQFYGAETKADNLQSCLDRILHFSTIDGGANQVRESYKRLGEILEEKGVVLETNVLYLCDKNKCDNCNNYCTHTHSIKHAKNFENRNGTYYEKEETNLAKENKRLSDTIDNMLEYIDLLKKGVTNEKEK